MSVFFVFSKKYTNPLRQTRPIFNFIYYTHTSMTTTKKHKDIWGRPTLMTEDVVQKLEEMFKNDSTVWEACLFAWIGKRTYYDRMSNNPTFAHRMGQAQSYAKILARKTLLKSMLSENEQVAQKWSIEFLKRRDWRYSDKVDSTVADSEEREQIEEKKLDDLTMLELEAMRKQILWDK